MGFVSESLNDSESWISTIVFMLLKNTFFSTGINTYKMQQYPVRMKTIWSEWKLAKSKYMKKTSKLIMIRTGSQMKNNAHGERANSTRLVLGCIEAEFWNQLFVGKLSPRSTQCTPFYSSQISIVYQKLLNDIVAKFLSLLSTFSLASRRSLPKSWRESVQIHQRSRS